MDYSLPGSSVHGIFQASVLAWGAIAFSEYKTKYNIKLSTLKTTSWRLLILGAWIRPVTIEITSPADWSVELKKSQLKWGIIISAMYIVLFCILIGFYSIQLNHLSYARTHKIYFAPIFVLNTKLSFSHKSMTIMGPLRFPNVYDFFTSSFFENCITHTIWIFKWYTLLNLSKAFTVAVMEELSSHSEMS